VVAVLLPLGVRAVPCSTFETGGGGFPAITGGVTTLLGLTAEDVDDCILQSYAPANFKKDSKVSKEFIRYIITTKVNLGNRNVFPIKS
jgi:hypothetical protein